MRGKVERRPARQGGARAWGYRAGPGNSKRGPPAARRMATAVPRPEVTCAGVQAQGLAAIDTPLLPAPALAKDGTRGGETRSGPDQP